MCKHCALVVDTAPCTGYTHYLLHLCTGCIRVVYGLCTHCKYFQYGNINVKINVSYVDDLLLCVPLQTPLGFRKYGTEVP